MSKYNLKLVLHIVFCGSLLFGCNSKPIDKNVEIIHIGKSEPQYLSKIIDNIEYVVLENPSMPFAKADKIFVFDEGIILADFWSNHTLLRYDQDGKFLNSIGRYGEGPGEYLQITDVDFDSKTRKLDILTPNRLMSFGINGDFIEEKKLNVHPYKFLMLDGDKHLFYVPQVMASDLREGFGEAILYNYSHEKKSVDPVLYPIFPEVLNYSGEKNNLFKMGKTITVIRLKFETFKKALNSPN